jgi:hypothetical protein
MHRFISSLLLSGAAAFFSNGLAHAEVEKFAQTSDRGIQLYWWPKIAPPAGCHHDDEGSFYNAVNAFAPDGLTVRQC